MTFEKQALKNYSREWMQIIRMIASAPSQSHMEKKYALYKQPVDREEWNDTLNSLEKWKSKEQYRAE